MAKLCARSMEMDTHRNGASLVGVRLIKERKETRKDEGYKFVGPEVGVAVHEGVVEGVGVEGGRD